MNMIGKISGKSWRDAPEGSTHIGEINHYWYKKENNCLVWYNLLTDGWRESNCASTLISKEEDLPWLYEKKAPVFFSVEELPIGWFVKLANGTIAVKIESRLSVSQITSTEEINVNWNDYDGFIHNISNMVNVVSYSETYAGEYTPIPVKEELSPAKVKLNEIEESIKKLQQQAEELKKEIK